MSRGRAILLAGAAALALSACQTTGRREPPPSPQPKPPPPLILIKPAPPAPAAAPKPCVPKALGPPPRYPDTDAALREAGGAADRYQLLAAGRILREQRLDELEKAIAACR
jgi:hypothetical protein